MGITIATTNPNEKSI